MTGVRARHGGAVTVRNVFFLRNTVASLLCGRDGTVVATRCSFFAHSIATASVTRGWWWLGGSEASDPHHRSGNPYSLPPHRSLLLASGDGVGGGRAASYTNMTNATAVGKEQSRAHLYLRHVTMIAAKAANAVMAEMMLKMPIIGDRSSSSSASSRKGLVVLGEGDGGASSKGMDGKLKARSASSRGGSKRGRDEAIGDAGVSAAVVAAHIIVEGGSSCGEADRVVIAENSFGYYHRRVDESFVRVMRAPPRPASIGWGSDGGSGGGGPSLVGVDVSSGSSVTTLSGRNPQHLRRSSVMAPSSHPLAVFVQAHQQFHRVMTMAMARHDVDDEGPLGTWLRSLAAPATTTSGSSAMGSSVLGSDSSSSLLEILSKLVSGDRLRHFPHILTSPLSNFCLCFSAS